MQEQMEGTLREMGVRYGTASDGSRAGWRCDLLPQIFTANEWRRIAAGVDQRLRAFELFLQDIYGPQHILHAGILPIHMVLGSPYFERACIALPRPKGSFLHLCGICLERDATGELAVKGHQLGRARGMAYMMQNRRALVRVAPELFGMHPVQPLTDVPLAISEAVRASAPEPTTGDPFVVLLSPGMTSASYYEHAFLSRRTGISLVEGGDLLVLDDHLYLKTVRGLKRVDVVFNRVADKWLDPLVLRRSSLLGVPGLVHCIRRGTVTLVNAAGAQLADDCALLCYGGKIIRFYLGEEAILPTLPTYWLGDLDQRELVLGNVDEYRIEPVSGDTLIFGAGGVEPSRKGLERAIRKSPHRYIAQPKGSSEATLAFSDGKLAEVTQDHVVFALRRQEAFEVFSGALTRVMQPGEPHGGIWRSKDAWVLGQGVTPLPPQVHRRVYASEAPGHEVTSRVAEAFYWLGRYLERSYHQAYLIQAIETLETEELNAAERKEYRPMWNRLLPPLETSAGASRRSITTRLDRYRLTLAPEPGSLAMTLRRVVQNAASVQESLSPEALATLNALEAIFQRTKYREEIAEGEASRTTLRLAREVTQSVPQFFAVADRTLLMDDGSRFCEVGEKFERATITANAVVATGKILSGTSRPSEIQLSAMLRLLGTRDAYRRVFQTRSTPAEVLEILWQHPDAPRSVVRCLTRCGELLRQSAAPGSTGAAAAISGIDDLLHWIQRLDWSSYQSPAEAKPGENGDPPALRNLLRELLAATFNVHSLISDGFLSHQAYIARTVQPLLQGFGNAI